MYHSLFIPVIADKHLGYMVVMGIQLSHTSDYRDQNWPRVPVAMLQSSSVYLYQGYASLGSSQPVIKGGKDVEGRFIWETGIVLLSSFGLKIFQWSCDVIY